MIYYRLALVSDIGNFETCGWLRTQHPDFIMRFSFSSFAFLVAIQIRLVHTDAMISKDKIEYFKSKFEVVSAFVEHGGEIVLLHRQDYKPQGNTWGAPAGKVNAHEDLLTAILRELKEEIGLTPDPKELTLFESYYVRYPEYDFKYHVYRLVLKVRPTIRINPAEHKGYRWIQPREALALDLIPDEDSCIKWSYGL